MNTNQLNIITLKLEKSALAGQLAGTYKALGYLEEGDRWGRLATVEREAALELTAGWPEPSPELATPPVTTFNSYYFQDHDPDLADALAVAREAAVKAGEAFFEGAPLPSAPEEDKPKPPALSLYDLGKGDTIRVFRETFFEGDRTSEAGAIYQHDGADEGAQPWCQDPLDTSNLVPYINSEDIREWELEQRAPTPALRDLGKGAVIRVFRENRHSERSSEGGIVYQHDGADEGDMPWCQGPSGELDDYLTPYLNSSDIIEWRAA